MRIAFDIDDTLWKLVKDEHPRIEGIGAMCACGIPVKQEEDKTMIELLEVLTLDLNTEVFLWSAGGVQYAEAWVKRHIQHLEEYIKVIPKEKGHDIDICFDDQDVDLAKIVLRVKREHADHWHDEDKAP